MFWVISVYFNIRNTLTKSGTFFLGHPTYSALPYMRYSYMFRLYKCSLHQAGYGNLNRKITKICSIQVCTVLHCYSLPLQFHCNTAVIIRRDVGPSCLDAMLGSPMCVCWHTGVL